MSRGAVSNKTFPGATGTEETKPGRKVRHTSRSQRETEVPDFHKNRVFRFQRGLAPGSAADTG